MDARQDPVVGGTEVLEARRRNAWGCTYRIDEASADAGGVLVSDIGSHDLVGVRGQRALRRHDLVGVRAERALGRAAVVVGMGDGAGQVARLGL